MQMVGRGAGAGDDPAGPVIGVAIGTTNFRVGIHRNNRIEVISDERGSRLIPAVVFFADTGHVVGQAALERMAGHPENTVTGMKWMIGRSYEEIVSVTEGHPFRLLNQDIPVIEVQQAGKWVEYTMEQVTSFLFSKAKERAQEYVGSEVPVKKVVIAIPADYSAAQITAMSSAATSAGLQVVQEIREPAAALSAHGLDGSQDHMLVFHCGGETTSATVMCGGQVKMTICLNSVAGRVFDRRLFHHCCDVFQKKTGHQIDVASDRKAVTLLQRAVEKAKVRLSQMEETAIHADNLRPKKDFCYRICRSQFEEMCFTEFITAVSLIDQVLNRAKLGKKDIRKVILTGGSSRIPKLVDMIADLMGREKVVTSESIDPDLTIISMTVVRAAILQQQEESQRSGRPIPSATHRPGPAAGPAIKRNIHHRSNVTQDQGAEKHPKKAKVGEAGPVIGIDLGTTFSCVGVWKDGEVHIISNEEGNRITPSCVAFVGDQRLVGDEAKDRAVIDPENVVFDAKRLIGRKFDDDTVQKDRKNWPFAVVNQNSKPLIEVDFCGKRRQFHAEQISAFVLHKLKGMAESFTGKKISEAVITVPAYFNNFQRTATKTAARGAGLKVLKIINEPTAAAIAYSLDYVTEGRDRNILVYDLGGGTFDVSILKVNQGNDFEVLATAGDTHLGGVDFDNRVFSFFRNHILAKYGRDVYRDKRSVNRLRFACEKAKVKLSAAEEAVIDIPDLMPGIDFVDRITRSKFEDLCDDLFKKTMKLMADAVRKSHLKKADICDIVLVGGSTRIPMIWELVQDFFGRMDLKLDINPEEAVANGAVMQAAVMSSSSELALPDFTIGDVTPLSLGMSELRDIMSVIIPRNTRIPVERTYDYMTTRDNQVDMDIDVFQGERTMTYDNVYLGGYVLKGLIPARRGKTCVKITFHVDEDGVLEVKARPRPGAPIQRLTIADPGQMSEAEVRSMISEASEVQANDRLIRKTAQAKNELYFACYDHRNDARIGNRCQETLLWLDEHPDASLDELRQTLGHLFD